MGDTNHTLNNILELYKNNKWKEILNYKNPLKNGFKNGFDWTKISWVWPFEENLHFIAKHVRNSNLSSITSVGCGTGIFEWLLTNCTGLTVCGIEVNEEWWCSSYAPPHFIPLQLTEYGIIPEVPKNSAIMFCYFNQHESFLKYLNKYRGSLLIIIGPGDGKNVFTNPMPFAPQFEHETEWELIDSQEIGDTNDFIAIYKR